MVSAERKKFAAFISLTWLSCLMYCLWWLLPAHAEQLPVRNYSIADGLAHDEISKIVQDSRGFLWFCTKDGLSRFDGYRFTTYGLKDGLPVADISNLFESRSGVYWVSTEGGGISRFYPSGSPTASGKIDTQKLFISYRISATELSNFVNVIYEDSVGRIWIGTDGGLYLLSEKSDGSVSFESMPLGPFTSVPQRVDEIKDIVEDAEGALCIATTNGLVRRLRDGHQVHYTISPSLPTDIVWALLLDKDKRLWIGHQAGLMVFSPGPASGLTTNHVNLEQTVRETKKGTPALAKGLSLPDSAGEAVWITSAEGLAADNVQALHQSADGRVWIGTRGGGLSTFDGYRLQTYASPQGLNNFITTLANDREGNLWIGTQASGAIKFTGNGLVSYREADGLGTSEIINIFETNAGKLCAISSKWTINLFDGERFTAIRPNLPKEIIDSSSGRWVLIEDHEGAWWVATGRGLYRFPKVARLEELARVNPQNVYTTRDGLADDNISRLFEDSRGDLWISSYTPPVMLTRWERATNTFHRFTEKDGHPSANWANVFGEDAAGNLWIGFHNGGLARIRRGRLETFGASEGVPGGLMLGFYRDRANRLWFATSSGGALRVDDPAGERPSFVVYSTAENLASNYLSALTEDNWGNIYIGTARGVDRLETQTNRVKHLTTADGLIKSSVTAAFRDRAGALWFGTREGLSRLIPEAEKQQQSPPVLIGGLRVGGIARSISELGEKDVKGLEFSAGENQIEIDYFGLNFSAGGGLRYQYKFEGASDDWSAPTDQRTVTASLSPGAYRFLVRAVSADGNVTLNPASISFTILPPLWQRWWFLTLLAFFIIATIYLLERYRVARVIELERVRTRIATDLHDDIGASLSQIAIVSEVVSQRVDKDNDKVTEPLQLIAETSREMVDAMSDIVWAINPKRDHLSDLSQRMRRFASDTLNARDINFRFLAPSAEKDIRLGTDLRREVYLIFKESVNNLVKYSKCTEADLEFSTEGDLLVIKVSDNGVGFEVERATNEVISGMGGHGLSNMRRRAEGLGGTYDVQSEKGKGTTVLVRVPSRGRRTKFSRLKKLLLK